MTSKFNHLNHRFIILAISIFCFYACNKSTNSETKTTKEVLEEPKPKVQPTTTTKQTKSTKEVTPSATTESTDDQNVTEEPTKGEQIYSGTATYYHDKFQGKNTASGEPYDRDQYTAAVRMNAIPVEFGTFVEVYSEKRKKKVKVKVNDKMSDKASGIIDLSYKAAEEIGLIMDGRTKVTVKVVD